MNKFRRICAVTMAGVELTAALLCFSAAPTMARYDNTVQWTGTYGTESVLIQSNYLSTRNETAMRAGNPPEQTNLLYDWTMSGSTSRRYDIKLFSNTEDVYAELECEDNDYLIAELEHTRLVLPTSEEDAIRLTLTPTEKALAITEPVTVTVNVRAKCSLVRNGESGEEQDLPQEVLTGVFQVNLIPAQVPPEETVEPTEPSDPTEETWEEPLETEPDEPTEPTEPEIPTGTLDVNVANVYARTEPVEWEFTVSEHTDRVLIEADLDLTTGLRYRVDGGSWIMLAEGGDILLEEPKNKFTLTMDFSWVEWDGDAEFSITTFYGDEPLCYLDHTLSGNTNLLKLEPDGIEPIIVKRGKLSVPYSGSEEGWSWNMEHLTQNTDGSIAYVRDDTGYQFGLKVSFSGGQIHISNTSGSAPPGTYRLVLEQIRQNTVITSVEMPLFIHY